MGAEVWPVTEDFAAEIGDVDLSQPLTPPDWQIVESAFNRYSVLIFPDQHLSQGQHVAFAERFGGNIDRSMIVGMDGVETRTPAEIADVGNIDADGSVMSKDNRLLEFQRGNRLWHTDSSFKDVPANASLLYMQSVPPVGGLTEFADARAAWDALPDTLKARIDGQVALHSIATSRARMGFEMTESERQNYPLVPQALVRRHRASARRSIYVASHAGTVVGLDPAASKTLLAELMAHVTQRQFVYGHRWRANDLVVWDNKCVLHRGRPYDDLRWPRDAQRATSLDVANTCDQEGLPRPDRASELLTRR